MEIILNCCQYKADEMVVANVTNNQIELAIREGSDDVCSIVLNKQSLLKLSEFIKQTLET